MKNINRPKCEPPYEDRQCLSIEYLGSKARGAHYDGNGPLVNHLSAIAYKHILRWTDRQNCHVPVRSFFWAIIMPLYWLVDEFILDSLGDCVNKFVINSDEDKALILLLKNILHLVGEPLDTEIGKINFFKESQFKEFEKINECEGTIFFTFALELIWYRDPRSVLWLEVANSWMKKAPDIYKKSIDETGNRLLLQTNLVIPGAFHQPPFNWQKRVPDNLKTLLEAWKALMQCDWDSFNPLLRRLAVSVPYESRLSLPVYRLHHLTRGIKHDFGDEQNFGITRLKMRVYTSGPSAFIKIRDDSIMQLLRDLLKDPNASEASRLRFHCIRLCMLNRISSLRLWDIASLIYATSNLSECYMEIAKFDKRYLAEGIFLSVISLSFNEKSQLIKNNLNNVDFIAQKDREYLIERLLESRPLEWHHTRKCFESLGDSLPENRLKPLAEWCVKYVDFPNTRLWGWTISPISFWDVIFPHITHLENVFRSLHPAILKFAYSPSIQTNENERLLTKYLNFAPLDLATELGEKLFSIQTNDTGAKEARWRIIYNAAIQRKELAERFYNQLSDGATDPITKHYFRNIDKCDTESITKETLELKNMCKGRIEEWSKKIIEREKGGGYSFGGEMQPVILESIYWKEEDVNLVGILLETLNSSFIYNHEVNLALQYLASFVRAGPEAFVTKIRDYIFNWIYSPPEGQNMFSRYQQQLSTFAFNEFITYGELFNTLSELIRAVAFKLSQDDINKIAKWVIDNAFRVPIESYANFMYLAIRIALSIETEMRIGLLSAAQVFIMRTIEGASTRSDKTVNILVRLLDEISRLFNPKNQEWTVFDSSKQEQALLFYQFLQGLLPQLRKFPHPDVRALTARILRLWQAKSKLPDNLQEVLDDFKNDARARVRYCAMKEA